MASCLSLHHALCRLRMPSAKLPTTGNGVRRRGAAASALLQDRQSLAFLSVSRQHMLMPCRTSDQTEAVPAAPPNKHAAMVRFAGPQGLRPAAAVIIRTQLTALQGIRLVVD